jgi:hypothetical protein
VAAVPIASKTRIKKKHDEVHNSQFFFTPRIPRLVSSSVGIAIGYGMDGRGSILCSGKGFIFSIAFRLDF